MRPKPTVDNAEGCRLHDTPGLRVALESIPSGASADHLLPPIGRKRTRKITRPAVELDELTSLLRRTPTLGLVRTQEMTRLCRETP